MPYNPMTASELIALKAAIKAEMARRCAPVGGLSEYAGSNYDFSSPPISGGVATAEYGQKTVDMLLHIADHDDLQNAVSGGFLDRPIIAARPLLHAEISEAITKFEPRAQLERIIWDADPQIPGSVSPTVEVSIVA